MSQDEQPLSAEQEARAAAYAAIVEADDYEPGTQLVDPAEVAALLAQIITPAERAAARGRAHPSLDGRSPARRVRLSVQLDAALVARAEAEGRRPSEVLRDAISLYLSPDGPPGVGGGG